MTKDQSKYKMYSDFCNVRLGFRFVNSNKVKKKGKEKELTSEKQSWLGWRCSWRLVWRGWGQHGCRQKVVVASGTSNGYKTVRSSSPGVRTPPCYYALTGLRHDLVSKDTLIILKQHSLIIFLSPNSNFYIIAN